MNQSKVDVYELIAWDLDEYPYRSSATKFRDEEIAKRVEQAQQRLARRKCYTSCPALLAEETENIEDLLAIAAQRTGLQEEYEGLDWTLGVVDLRRLLAFQRRLVFRQALDPSPTPKQDDWSELISLAMGSQRNTEHRLSWNRSATNGVDIKLHSDNPDLQLRVNQQNGRNGHSPLVLYGGSSFFEVAEFRGRWFLRDGYHRAYRLLRAGVHRIPSVVIYSRTIEELGATEPWFFSEAQLFLDRPPQITDFLDDSLILQYERVALRKVIRIRVEELLQPFEEIDEIQGGKL